MDIKLLENIREELWEPLPDDGGQWLPIMFAKGTVLGARRDGGLMIKKDGVTRDIVGANAVACLVFLESPLQELVAQIKGRFGAALGQQIVNQIALIDIVRAGLVQGSDYWAALAVLWCKQIHCGDLLATELQGVQSSKWASQKTKQNAKKLLAR